MRKTELSKRDIEISGRLRYAREQLIGLTQDACARQLDMRRTTLANYESCRTPLKFDVALRFCRQFVISEEWLATGRYDGLNKALKSHDVYRQGQTFSGEFNELISSRLCMDLWSERDSRYIRAGTPFGEAYSLFLAPKYEELISVDPFLPRILLSHLDGIPIAANYLSEIHKIHLNFVDAFARNEGKKGPDFWRVYSVCCIQVSELICRRVMGFGSSEDEIHALRWFRALLENKSAVLPPVGDKSWDSESHFQPQTNQSDGLGLINRNESITYRFVPHSLPELLKRLKSATDGHGKKSELASYMGVAHPTISVWLSGKQEPGGDATLRLLSWVLGEENRQKSSVDVVAPKEQRTQSRNRRETKAKPNPSQG